MKTDDELCEDFARVVKHLHRDRLLIRCTESTPKAPSIPMTPHQQIRCWSFIIAASDAITIYRSDKILIETSSSSNGHGRNLESALTGGNPEKELRGSELKQSQ